MVFGNFNFKDLEGIPQQVGVKSPDMITSGSLIADRAFGGGYARGAFSFVSGMEGSGKTSLALLAGIAAVQRGESVAVVSTERRWNSSYARDSGMGEPGPNGNYLLLEPQYQEQALDGIRALAKQGINLIIFDSLTAKAPLAELKGELTDNTVGLMARLNSQFFRMATDDIVNGNTVVLIIGQLREYIGKESWKNTVRPGGKAKDHYSDLAFDLWGTSAGRREMEGTNKDPRLVGMTIRGQTWKNIYVPSHRGFEFNVRFLPGLHINIGKEISELGREYGILTKSDGTSIKSSNAKHYYDGKEIAESGKDLAEKLNRGDFTDMKNELTDVIRAAIIS